MEGVEKQGRKGFLAKPGVACQKARTVLLAPRVGPSGEHVWPGTEPVKGDARWVRVGTRLERAWPLRFMTGAIRNGEVFIHITLSARKFERENYKARNDKMLTVQRC